MPFELIEIARHFFWVIKNANGSYSYVPVGHLELEEG